jgi:hypothetical protein
VIIIDIKTFEDALKIFGALFYRNTLMLASGCAAAI